MRQRLAAGLIVARANVAMERPDRLPKALLAMAPWGPTLAGAMAGAAARYPDRVAVHDDDGSVTYRELWQASSAVGAALSADGVGVGARIGLLARNHRGFVTALVGASVAGADVVLLNTGFAGPQLADVVVSERIDGIIHDNEFTPVVTTLATRAYDEAALAAMASGHRKARPPAATGTIVILTSGTTGRPKGAARRSDPAAIVGAAAVLERIPFRPGDVQVIAAPLFHAWGLTNLLFGVSRCATAVLSRRFDAAATVAALARHRADVLIVVPVMLSRLLAVPNSGVPVGGARSAKPARLRIIASSGSALGGGLATEVQARFGPVLYNLYGSTEVAVATIATPDDLRAYPSTAGRPAFGVRVELLDERGAAVPDGEIGRVFVGGAMRFDGYTDGGTKEQHRGLLSSGDMGRFVNGLLFVEGREDDMIVSGGENVFPGEVEDLITAIPGVAEAAVVGVRDDEFGQVLSAFVVVRPGASLTDDDVRAAVRSGLARYKVPRAVTFLEALPRNETGKVLRRQLADRGAT